MTRVTGLKVTPRGQVTRFESADGERLLSSMYEAIGCELVDCLNLDTGASVWVDDEGWLPNMPVPNGYLSKLVGPIVYFAGTGLLLGGIDEDGETLSLTTEQEKLALETMGLTVTEENADA